MKQRKIRERNNRKEKSENKKEKNVNFVLTWRGFDDRLSLALIQSEKNGEKPYFGEVSKWS